MDYLHFLLLWTCSLLPDFHFCFNFDTKNFKLLRGPKRSQFGYTVQQHEAGGRQWLLVGAPFEFSDNQQTGDVYRCPLDDRAGGNCSRLHLGKLSLDSVSEHKDQMRLGMTLASNPKDGSFLTCGPLWSHECGGSFYSTGICSRISRNFRFSNTIAPALQRCETFMDIVIVLDGSNSIYPWYEVQNFLINILQKFNMSPGQTQVGLVQYGSRVVHEFSLSDHQSVEEVVEAASSMEQRGGEETRTALGIKVARQEAFQRGGRPGARKVMIVITDGESHDSPDLAQVVERSRMDNITMYAIAVLGYYSRRGINPESFLKEIKFIASDPDEQHFFNVTDESGLKDIVDALGERIFSLEGTSSQGRGFGLQMAQAGFSSHIVQDGVLVGAVGAYNWNGAVLKETRYGKIVPPKSSYQEEFPEELKNHAAYLGYAVSSMVTARNKQLHVAGAPRFNHTGKVITFTLKNNGNLHIQHTLQGEQIGSYFGSELSTVDVDGDGHTDVLLVAAPMYYSQGWERGKVYVYSVSPQSSLALQGALEVTERAQNSRLGSALAQIPDVNGDGLRELVVGAPLEDEHQGAIYVFYGENTSIQRKYKQRISSVSLSLGLQYFGRSLHGVLDVNRDGLVDLSVGALGGAVLLWSRGVVRIRSRLTFEPEKVNIFNKDCRHGGKAVSCLSVSVCLTADAVTKTGSSAVGVWFSLVLDERRVPPRAVLDEADRKQPRGVFLLPGQEACQALSFYVQETADYGRPIAVVMETGLQSQDEGPVLDPEWPTVLRTELRFWNGCEHEESCVPNLVLHSHTDLEDLRQFCSLREGVAWALCSQQGAMQSPLYVLESSRTRLVVYAVLENQGENAYGVQLHISSSRNLLFSSLRVKDQSDLQMECHSEDRLSNQMSCNISAPFMRSMSQLSFHLEFEFSRSVFLGHLQVVMETSSEGDEKNPDDNINHIYLPLKYQAKILFTRLSEVPRFEIKHSSSSSSSLDPDESSDLEFNLTYQVQNLGVFPLEELQLWVEIWSITGSNNHLVEVQDCSAEPAGRSDCVLPPRTRTQDTVEDLHHLPQLNHSNSRGVVLQCTLGIPASSSVHVSVRAKLQLQTLQKVRFRSLELVAAASIHLPTTSAMFIQEGASRVVLVEIRREELHRIPIWIILGSSLGGLVLLGLLVLALWKLGFFNRRMRQEGEEPPAETL